MHYRQCVNAQLCTSVQHIVCDFKCIQKVAKCTKSSAVTLVLLASHYHIAISTHTSTYSCCEHVIKLIESHISMLNNVTFKQT